MNTIKDFCKGMSITEDQFYGREKVGGSLDLNGLTSIPEGFNPTVGGHLYLRGLTSIPEGFNPTVGGYLDLSGNLSAPTKPYRPKPFVWNDGKYIMVDGLFTEVVRKRGNVYVVKKINATKEFYLVTDGDGNWSHGDTLKKAKEDLVFKVLSEKMKNEPLSMESIVDVPRYRAITGACSTGVQMFRDAHGLTKDRYTVKELLPILEKNNAYGIQRFKQLIQN